MLPVFLDRDGVLNENRSDYVKSPGEWSPIPGAVSAVARLRSAGHPVIVVTNQSCIGRGMTTEEDVRGIHSVMISAFEAAGAHGVKVFYCPHSPGEGCGCRKPETGMVARARMVLGLAGGGWLVGDAETDIIMGRRAGLVTVMVKSGRGALQLAEMRRKGAAMPEYILADLSAAADMILTPSRR